MTNCIMYLCEILLLRAWKEFELSILNVSLNRIVLSILFYFIALARALRARTVFFSCQVLFITRKLSFLKCLLPSVALHAFTRLCIEWERKKKKFYTGEKNIGFLLSRMHVATSEARDKCSRFLPSLSHNNVPFHYSFP